MTFDGIKTKLRAAGIENAEGEAFILAEHYLKIPPSKLIIMKNTPLPFNEELEKATARRCLREPLQYIIGEWGFMDEVYTVTPDVLIPRQDTEVLVDFAIRNIPHDGKFADLCTGSGCVAISLAAKRKDLYGVAIEKYSKTLEVAVLNSEKNKVAERIDFALGDVTEDVFENGEKFDAILSNPPYVSLAEYDGLGKEERQEPRNALTDGSDGLTIIKRILDIYPAHIKENGFLAIEIGFEQGNKVKTESAKRGLLCEIITDIEGRDRVCVLKQCEKCI